jgi:hypothetical protein
MSSEILPSEKEEIAVATKSLWTVHLKTSTQTYHFILELAKRDERSVAYIVSKLLEAYYEEKSKLEII